MKRIINGVTYSTDTSTRIAETKWEEHQESKTGVLYQTRGGAFFIDTETIKNVWNEREGQSEERTEHSFEPLSADDAHKWIMEGEVEVFHSPFDDPPEAAAEAEPGATIYIRVPDSLKRSVDKAAREAKISGNIWAMRCIERCLEGPHGTDGRCLANAYWAILSIKAQGGDGYTMEQVIGIAEKAVDEIESAWVERGFADDHSKVSGQMMDRIDAVFKQRLNDEFPLYGEVAPRRDK